VFDFAIDWRRPLDGVVLETRGDTDGVETWETHFLVARSDRFAPISHTASDFEDPLCIRLINSHDTDGLIEFSQRFGLPSGGVPADGDREPGMAACVPLVEGLQDDLENIVFADFEIAEHIAEVNRVIPAAAVTFRFDHVGGRHRMVSVVKSLADYLLLEAAAARSAGAVGKSCQHCGRAFLTGPLTGRRSTAKFCKDNCRVAAMRARKSEDK
jgi:hypothetical protein